jgi:hypothetical protein
MAVGGVDKGEDKARELTILVLVEAGQGFG